jgi:hypothetical protein
MTNPDQEDLLARAEQERARATQASDELLRAIHLKLAHEYAMLPMALKSLHAPTMK